MNRGTKRSKRSVTGTGKRVCHAQWWEEDLDDVIDILRQETSDTTHVSQTSLNNDLLMFPTLLPVQIASRPGITVQSDFSIPYDSGKVAVDTPNITDNFVQPSDITRVQNSLCVMDGTESGPETSSPENSSDLKLFSRESQDKLLLQYCEIQEGGNPSNMRKPASSMHNPKKLFGILSLILQALNTPLTEVLEECYTGVLQRALAEIQSAVTIYNSLNDPMITNLL